MISTSGAACVNGRLLRSLAFVALIAAPLFVGGCAREQKGHAAPAPFDSKLEEPEAHRPFRLERGNTDLKRWRVVFTKPAPYLHALDMAPLRRESVLDKGGWLVVTFLVTSVPDLMSVDVAIQVAKRYKGKLHLGVRPSATCKETKSWLPEYGDNHGSPVWVVYRHGKLQGWEVGPLTEADVESLLSKCLFGKQLDR